jgi:predicted phage terminase large subunit-like protein
MPLSQVKQRGFDKEVEALRQMIQASAKPFPDDKAAQRSRKAQAALSLDFFCKTYFPHYFNKPSSRLHQYFSKRYLDMIQKAIQTGEGDKEANAAPRGNAKSTWGTFGLPLWCAAFRKRKYALIVSETRGQAESFLSFIKLELETNERLQQDFPELCGEGPKWAVNEVITRNGVKLQAAGAGQKLRGLRHGNCRPDLVIVDDLENDESVESPEQRRKLENWFFKALMKIGQPDTVFIVVGTILHYDSLLSRLLVKPGWKGRKFQAVLQWSKSKRWEEWEQVFSDISQGKELAEARADNYFDTYRVEMLAGTEVLWPEMEPYYYLMKMRVSDGPAYFDSEKQNEPLNPEDQIFFEEWFQDWEDGDVDLAGIPHAGACDPSLGKRNKRNDPSAILGGRMKDRILYLDIADISQRRPDAIMSDILAYHERDRFDKFRMETVQFQEFFARSLEQLSHDTGLTLNIEDKTPNTDKDLRIIRLQPWIKNGWIRFKPEHRELKRQLLYYRPKGRGGHDDGPDCLEMLLDLCEGGLVSATCAKPAAEANTDQRDSLLGRVRRAGRMFRRMAA